MKVILGFYNKIRRDHADAYAAQSAFFTVMSFVPFLMLLLSIFQFVPQTKEYFTELITLYIPTYFESFLLAIVNEVYERSVALTSVSAIFSVWTASVGLFHLAEGLNAVYEIEETRSWIRLRARAMLNTVLMIMAIVGLLVMMVFGDFLHENLATHYPWVRNITAEILSHRVVILSITLTLIFAIFYKVLPNRKATLLGQLPGAMFCAVCWMVFSYFLSIYVSIFNGFSMYGSLMMIALILFWLYFCMYFVMIGGAMNFYFNAFFRKTERYLKRCLKEYRQRKIQKKQEKLEAKQEQKKEQMTDEE